ncbi:MAG: hypothetical protein Q8L64_03640 [bacterium]|nr:hypothetical protein [bacterium]
MKKVAPPAHAFPGALEHIIVLRHEECTKASITPNGQTRLGNRARNLVERDIVKQDGTGVISSHDISAVESLRFFIQSIGLLINRSARNAVFEELFSSFERCDVEAAFDVVSRFVGLRTLVVFTHKGLATELPYRIGKALDMVVTVPSPLWGHGVHFDVLHRRTTFLGA